MTRKTGWMILAILFVLSPLSAAFGAWTNPELLYSVAQAEKIVGDSTWVILDCRGQEVYEKGHIPGAIVLGKKSAKSLLRDGSAAPSRIRANTKKSSARPASATPPGCLSTAT